MLAAILQQSTDGFTKLHREILVQLMPHGAELESAVVEDLSNITLTFINGLLLRFAHGDRILDSAEQLDDDPGGHRHRHPEEPGKGRLTRIGSGRPTRRPQGSCAGLTGRLVRSGHGYFACESCQSIRCMVLYENRENRARQTGGFKRSV